MLVRSICVLTRLAVLTIVTPAVAVPSSGDRLTETSLDSGTTGHEARDEARSGEMWHHLNFLEIGTSDFNSLAQSYAPPGVSVEALQCYQERLFRHKNRPPGIKLVNAAAIGNHELLAGLTNLTFFYVNPEEMKEHRLPPWFRGMGSIHKMQLELKQQLTKRLLRPHLPNIAVVPTTSYTRLVTGVRSLGLVKLDMEGVHFACTPINSCNHTTGTTQRATLWPL